MKNSDLQKTSLFFSYYFGWFTFECGCSDAYISHLVPFSLLCYLQYNCIRLLASQPDRFLCSIVGSNNGTRPHDAACVRIKRCEVRKSWEVHRKWEDSTTTKLGYFSASAFEFASVQSIFFPGYPTLHKDQKAKTKNPNHSTTYTADSPHLSTASLLPLFAFAFLPFQSRLLGGESLAGRHALQTHAIVMKTIQFIAVIRRRIANVNHHLVQAILNLWTSTWYPKVIGKQPCGEPEMPYSIRL